MKIKSDYDKRRKRRAIFSDGRGFPNSTQYVFNQYGPNCKFMIPKITKCFINNLGADKIEAQ